MKKITVYKLTYSTPSGRVGTENATWESVKETAENIRKKGYQILDCKEKHYHI